MSDDPVRQGRDEWRGHPRSRRYRWLAPVALLGVAAVPVVELTTPGDPAGLLSPTYAAMLPLGMLTWYSPFAAGSRWFGPRAPGDGDAFEQAVLGRASRIAHAMTTAIVGLVFGWLAFAAWRGWPVPTLPRQWAALGLAIVLAAAALPIVIAEFLMPFPPAPAPEDDR